MKHSDDPVSRPVNEGEAVRIGPLLPGETEDEFHVYFRPEDRARTLFITRDMEEESLRLTVRLIIGKAALGRDVLVSLRLLEAEEGRERSRGFRLLMLSGAGSPDGALEAPPVQFLLPVEEERPARHFIIRVNAKYVSESTGE